MQYDANTGLVTDAEYIASENCDERPSEAQVEAIIIHCISLPPGQYGNDCVADFFCNNLDVQQHEYFNEIEHLTVSSHFFIQRNGRLNQFVPTTMRAWHAGESVCLGKPMVNNFSIGIELEGLDTDPQGFSDQQYQVLSELTTCLLQNHTQIKTNNIFAHSDIAPGRKTDPGPYFDWNRFLKTLNQPSCD